MVVQSELRPQRPQGQDVNDKRQRLRQRFEVVKKLGQGTYGKVQLAINKETNGEVAIKTIKKAKIENEQDLVRIRREIQIMASIQHPHIIHIYEVFENSEKIVLVMQYASGGELYDYLGCHRKMPEKEARRVFRQIATAIYYCHKNKICHRDLKLENILLDDKGNAKIADFGLSNLFDERKKLRTFCGSPLYASPEIVKGTPYCGPEVDCWSLGVLLYTLVYGAMPFDGRNFKRLVKQISEGDYYEPSMKSKASGIIRRLLTVDVNYRATIKDICLDEWVNEGYDHSLLKLANDMADLTPVTVSSSTHAFPSAAAANLKDLCIQNTETLTKNHHKNELSTYAKLKRNDFQTNKGVLSNSSSTDVFKIKSSPKQLAVSENAVPCEVKFVMGSILTTVEKMVQRSMLISSKQNTLNAKDDVANETNSPLRAADIKNVCEKKLIESNENDVKNPVPNSDLKGSMINQNADKGIDLDITKNKCKPDENREAANNADGVILRNEMSPTKNRDNRKEHIKTWNVNIDQTQLIPKEADSIIPIFDVTSIIPKRPSRKSSKGLQEQLIQKEDDIKKTEKRAISRDPSKDEDLRKCPKSHDENTRRAPQYSEINATKSEKSETILSSLSKHRNDVIDYINNIFSRHKLSTQIIRHSELDTKENTSEMKSKQPKDICDSHSASQTTNENITEPTSNTCPIKPMMEASTKNTENASPTQNGEIGTVSYATESPQGKMKISKAEKIAKVNQREICQERDDPEREKQGESDGVNSSSPPPHESKLTPVTPKEHKLRTEEVNSEVKRSSEDKNFENGKVSKIRKNSTQLISNSAENGTESISHPHKQRISLRNTVKARNINGEDDKFQQGNAKRRLKNRSYSVGNNENINELEKILRRPRKYSLCALLAASFEFEQMAARQTRKDSDTLKKAPGKVEIPKSFDPSLEPDPQTPTDKRDFILIPSISVAENKQKMENEIEKVKLSALRMMRRKSEACSRRKMKQYTRSCTDILQRMEDINVDAFNLIQNCNQYELAQLNGSVDYLMDGNFKFGNELNFPIDHWSAENFDHSQPLPLQGNESYVPISRCCKKINFPPKPQQNDDKAFEAEENESEICTMSPYFEYSEGKDIDGNLEYNCNRNSTSKKLVKKKNMLQHSLNDKNKRESKSIQIEEGNAEEEDNKSIGQSESMYSSSVDKDSSDNDDDLDEIFGTKLDAQGSEDLCQFLKSVNTDISNHLKRIRYNKSLCSRSKSQECKTSVDHNAYEKLLTRSRSKEEKQNSQSIRPGPPESIGDSCYCSLASDFNHNSCAHMDKEQSDFSISMKNSQSLDEEFGSAEKDLQYDTHHQFSGSLKEKYYSLSNLEDPRTFLYPQNFQEGYKSKKCKSWATVPDLDDDAVFLQKNGDISPSTMRRLAIYNTMRPKQLQKGNRSQSQAMLNADKNIQTNGQETSPAISKHNINYTDKEHSISLRSKAQSDFNISSKELPYDLGSLNNLHNSDTSNRNSQRFCKSLGSRLNLESLNYSTDILSKKSHKTKENCHKKRERKVSFLDVSKSKNSNFGLESVAKAQKVLNSIDREVDTSPPEETGTLLEALKTQGYRTLISQRLQESEASEGPMNRRYSWACMQNIANTYPDSLSTLISEKGNMSLEDYTRYLLWNRNTFDTADDITYGNEILDDGAALYSDINMLNDIYVPKHYQNTESNWRVPPNMWLYQNLNNFRSVPNTSEEFVPHDWDNSVLFPTYNEGYEYDLPEFNSGIYLNAHQGKFNKKKHKASFEDDQHTPTFNEAGLQTNSPSTIEKLSIKIKALKNRCNQKSFDDLNNYKDQSSEPALSKEAEKRFSSTFDTNGTEDTSESVSDRIWRKSFYSRFNDVSTQRRRRSTFMESDFSADSFSTTLPKHYVNDEYSTDGSKIKKKEPISYSSTKGMDQKHVNGIDRSIDDDILLIKENDQHIPHPTTSKEQVDQIEDR